MGNPKVSIILPTYNVEKYLHQCLDSITKQTYKNIEVIIIIDGATDRSYDIAKQFCCQDSRFHAYWQENAGSGPARNHGLEKATGELIMFVDPDDWCKPEYVEKMVGLQQEKDYDLVTAGETSVFFDSNNHVKKSIPYSFAREEFIGEKQVRLRYSKLFELGLLQAPHCKVYKANIIKIHHVVFPDLRRSQDIVFNYRYYNYVQNVIVSSNCDYMYRVLMKERTLRLKTDYNKTLSFIYNDIKEIYNKWGIAFEMTKISTVLYGSIYALFESCALRGEKFNRILNDKTILEIIQAAQPERKHLKIVKNLVLSRQLCLAYYMVKVIYFIKNIIK